MKDVLLEIFVAAMATYGFWHALSTVQVFCRRLAARYRRQEEKPELFDKNRK